MFLRRLLVPVDLSSRAAHALDWAFQLAAATGAEVDVIHVVPGPGQLHAALDDFLGRPLPHASQAALAHGRDQLQGLVERVAHRGIAPRLVVDSGDTAAVIVRRAAESGVDLIVMATRGHRGVAEVMLGSVAHKVITCAPCPVVTLAARA